jgi:hypothetical protein
MREVRRLRKESTKLMDCKLHTADAHAQFSNETPHSLSELSHTQRLDSGESSMWANTLVPQHIHVPQERFLEFGRKSIEVMSCMHRAHFFMTIRPTNRHVSLVKLMGRPLTNQEPIPLPSNPPHGFRSASSARPRRA